MPITHTTIPVPPAQVGETEWAEAHTLPTAAEIGALTAASADERYLTPGSASAIYLLSQDASTTYARQASCVTTAQLGVYLLSNDASTTYARQTSAVTTAQLSIYLTSASAEAIYLTSASASTVYARQVSAVTTAQLGVYLLSQDASTTYARQTSAVTTAQLGVYLLSNDASTTYARQASAVTTAQLSIYLLSNDASTTYARQVSVMTTAQVAAGYASIGAIVSTVNVTEASLDSKYGVIKMVVTDVSSATIATVVTIPELIFSVSGSVAYQIGGNLVYRSSATATNIGVLVSVTPTPSVFMLAVDIYGQAADGTAAVFSGYASANGDIIIDTSTNAAAIDLPITLNGTIVTGAAGQIQVAFRSEVSNSNVVIRRGSNVRVTRLGAV